MEKRNLSRKTFLKGSGAALATLGLTSCAARTSGSANKEELADTSDAPKEEGRVESCYLLVALRWPLFPEGPR